MSFLSLLGFGTQDAQAPPPNANEALVQRETLEELRKGIISDRCTVQGYLCKQGEKTIFFFKEVKHYRSATHSEHLGRSAGASVRIAKVSGFAPEPTRATAFGIRPWTTRATEC